MAHNDRSSRSSTSGSNGEVRRNYILEITTNKGNNDTVVPLLKFGSGNNQLKVKENMSIVYLEK